jgi:hypothetical protein
MTVLAPGVGPRSPQAGPATRSSPVTLPASTNISLGQKVAARGSQDGPDEEGAAGSVCGLTC